MSKPALTVWYNTRCPVCDGGITRQKRRLIEAIKAGRIEFRDINLEPAALAGYGASLEDIRRRLHATDAEGRLLVGADVAVAVWRATPGEGWLATLFGNPVALPLTRWAYDRFADLLYAWNRRKARW
ncbi:MULTISPECIES: DCC1-like thiol-disulfide oxidoreductase family protein [unclassified Mesorhizobium]|uniref:thiol-disulfide oxidoreductase DCC family protein n=1 Tax=unclassified Mesorhizobium TaxID=325217 RepID=UPI0033397CE6